MASPKDITENLVFQKTGFSIKKDNQSFKKQKEPVPPALERRMAVSNFSVFCYSAAAILGVVEIILIVWMDLF